MPSALPTPVGPPLPTPTRDSPSVSPPSMGPLGTIAGVVLGVLAERSAEVYLEGVPIRLLDDRGVSVATTMTEEWILHVRVLRPPIGPLPSG